MKVGELIKINAELLRLSKALAEAVKDYEVTAIEAAEMRSQYDISWAQALLKFRFEKDATEAIKKAMATDTCGSEMTQARVKEAMRDALKERIRALEQVLSVQQSRLRYMDESERAM